MLKIRKAKREDADAAWNIRNAAILSQCVDHYSADQLKIWTGGHIPEGFADVVERHFHVATYNDAVIGTGMIDLRTGKIDAMFVHPNYMRTGVGKKIIQHIEHLALDNGLSQLSLESTLNAAPFYRACGFEGHRIGKYESPRGISLDCVPMIRNLRLTTPSSGRASPAAEG